MAVQLIRPNVSDLVIRTFDRALHPELFEHHRGLTVASSQMKLEIRLCASGHVLLLRTVAGSLTEVLVDHRTSLPQRRRIVDYRLRGCRTESVELDAGLQYDMSCQVETLHLDIFLRMNEELEQDCRCADLSARLPPVNRFLPGPLSVIRTEIGRGSLLVYAFHTFPEHSAIVKTQSLFQLADHTAENSP
ncbi:DUF2617 family protein [Schlesneria paludicola]|uniref:DUF2617 family protein n=1 Tax=Schlesneria paludicola TaxID=360056 RepID=UPI00029AA2EF|nr:DUF2617 family protein [Schlesneria paludicola]